MLLFSRMSKVIFIIADDSLLIKNFSKMGILAALRKLDSESSIRLFGNTMYWKLGIFLDMRCHDPEMIASLFYQV